MFAVCNPILNSESQIGLALRILCGFGIDEIADAFLSNKQTINKRLFRAKEKLRNEKIAIEFPPESEIKNRLENVLTTLYLLFNEGYYSASQNLILQKDLCFEAMRLTNLLVQNESTNTPSVNALISLMCYHTSRFDARTNENGEFVIYEEQNTKLWNKELIEKGNYFLIQSSYGNEISKFHLESRIAFWHTKKTDSKIKWENILQLYNQLLQLNYSPIVALNRTYALAKVKGNKVAIKEAEKINAENNSLYFMLLAKLHEEIDPKKRLFYLEKAWSLAKTERDKSFISTLMKK
jgi:RNA polymerase sigma-70 factor (ECF subfamily)